MKTTPDINKVLRAHPVNCRYGAPMGARNNATEEALAEEKLYLQKIRFVSGDYAPDGTYWGGGSTLWCAWHPTSNVRIYVRGCDRKTAIDEVLRYFPTAKIRNGGGA